METSPLYSSCSSASPMLRASRAAVQVESETLGITTVQAALGAKETRNHLEPCTHLTGFVRGAIQEEF